MIEAQSVKRIFEDGGCRRWLIKRKADKERVTNVTNLHLE